MAAGADKIIAFDPPGAIGLATLDAVVYLRFDEADSVLHPKDAAGALDDLQPATGLVMPSVVDGACGPARLFDPNTATGLTSTDLAGHSSLLTRDITIQAIVRLDAAKQNTAATPGAIVARGKGNSSSEYLAYALEVEVVDLPSFTFEMRWLWQTTAGVLKTETGAQFTLAPPGTAFTMLTATRRWVSPTEVVLRYYIGDLLLGEVSSADGDIGGATTGTFQVGTRFSGAYTNFLAGRIDELAILDREVVREEIEDTWLRITRYQPLGYQLIKEMHDPGFPLPTDPGSDVQKDLRLWGHALGYAASTAENLRANILPQRAYGEILEQWEEVLRVTPAPNSGVEDRRARVLARMRQRRGCSIPGIKDILPSLLGGGTVDDLEFIAFSNELDSDFTAIDPLRWDITPAGAFTAVSGAASCQPGAGTYIMDGATRLWRTMREIVGGNGKQAHQLTKLVWTTPQDTAEAGIYFENACTGDYILLGLRDVAGSFKVYSESFIAGVSQGAVLQATIGANPAAIWLHLYQTTTDGTWKAAWSTTSGTAGFTVSANITHPTVAHWGGCYLRTIGGAVGAGPRADFDDHKMLCPFSGRPMSAYVLLDRALGFSPDIPGANSVIQAIKHGFVEAAFITNPVLLAGDPDGGAGVAPCGGY